MAKEERSHWLVWQFDQHRALEIIVHRTSHKHNLAFAFHLEYKIQRELPWAYSRSWLPSKWHFASFDVLNLSLLNYQMRIIDLVLHGNKILKSLLNEWNWCNFCVLNKSFNEEEALYCPCVCSGNLSRFVWIHLKNLWETSFSSVWIKLWPDCKLFLGNIDHDDYSWVRRLFSKIKCWKICWNFDCFLGSAVCVFVRGFFDQFAWLLRRRRKVLLFVTKT